MTSALANEVDRRRAVRRSVAPEEPLARVRLRAGRELDVVDVSALGALVEGPTRLLPGTHVDVHLTTRDGRVLVRSRIVRAYVSQVEGNGIRYRGALAFGRLVDTAPGYPVPAPLVEPFVAPGITYPDPGLLRPLIVDEAAQA